MKKTDLRGAPERRSLSAPFEVRAASDSVLTLTGYASVFNAPYDIMGGPPYGFSEVVDSRAFERTLKASPDLHLLINHEGMPLARTKSGTLALSTDGHGLKVQATLDRLDPDVQRLEPKMARGDMNEMSFAFRTLRDSWNDDETERRLLEVSLDKGDVSVVNFGANPATHSELQRALRSLSGKDLVGAKRTITRMLAREAAVKSQRALDPEDVNVLTQCMGWFTAIDNIADGVTEGDPEYAAADLATLIIAIDAIADEAQEAIAAYLGVPTPDPDDVDGDEPPVRSRNVLPKLTESQQALANARAYNRVQPRSNKIMSVAEALASI